MWDAAVGEELNWDREPSNTCHRARTCMPSTYKLVGFKNISRIIFSRSSFNHEYSDFMPTKISSHTVVHWSTSHIQLVFSKPSSMFAHYSDANDIK